MKEIVVMKDRNLGRLCLLSAVLLFGMGGFIIKLVPWNGLAVVCGRTFLAAIVHFVCLTVFRKEKLKINKPTLIGALFVAGDMVLYTVAVKYTAAGNAVILENTSPIFVIIIGCLFLGLKPKRRDILTCAIVFAGVLIFIFDGLSAGNLFGNALALISGVCYGGMILLRSMKGCDSSSAFVLGFIISAVISSPGLMQVNDWSPTVIMGIMLLGVFQAGLAYMLLDIGIKHTPPIEASFICTLEPAIGTILVAIICHEYMTPTAIIGFLIIFTAVVLYSMPQKKSV